MSMDAEQLAFAEKCLASAKSGDAESMAMLRRVCAKGCDSAPDDDFLVIADTFIDFLRNAVKRQTERN